MSLPARQAGCFTLIEALLAAAILAMSIAAIAMPFTAGARSQQWDAERGMAGSLAQEMMEEILVRPLSYPDRQSDPGAD